MFSWGMGGGPKIFGEKIDVGGGGVKFFCFPPLSYDAKWNSPQSD